MQDIRSILKWGNCLPRIARRLSIARCDRIFILVLKNEVKHQLKPQLSSLSQPTKYSILE